MTIFNGKIHYKRPFSIAMLNYQRVNPRTIYWFTTTRVHSCCTTHPTSKNDAKRVPDWPRCIPFPACRSKPADLTLFWHPLGEIWPIYVLIWVASIRLYKSSVFLGQISSFTANIPHVPHVCWMKFHFPNSLLVKSQVLAGWIPSFPSFWRVKIHFFSISSRPSPCPRARSTFAKTSAPSSWESDG